MNINSDIKKIAVVFGVLCLASALLASALTVLVYSRYAMPVVSTQASSKLDSLKLDGRFDRLVLEVEGHLTQTTNLIEAQQSDNTVVFSLDNDGSIGAAGTLSVTGGITFAGDIAVVNVDASGYVSATTAISSAGTLDVAGATTLEALSTGVAGTGADVYFYSDTSGDHLFYDESDEVLNIIGTNAQTALNVSDGNAIVNDDLTVTAGGLDVTAGATTLEALATGVAGTGADVYFYSNTSGDHLFWDTANKVLNIIGTDAATALNVSDGNVSITDDLDVTGSSEFDGGLTVDDTAFIVANATGDTTISGTLTVSSTAIISSGLQIVTAQYGPGLWVEIYGEMAAEHTNQTGSYDHTGGAFETLFTRTAGDNFAQADADNGNWILLTGANVGAMAEIKTYINANTVIVEGLGWDGDLASQTFEIHLHPSVVSGDNAQHEFSVESGGKFEVFSYAFTNGTVASIKNRAAADDIDTLKIEVDGGGYDRQDGLKIEYTSGDLQPADRGHPLHITIDETGAVSSDATTLIEGIVIETTDAMTVEKHAIHVGVGFDEALHVSGGAAVAIDYGYEVTSASVVTRTAEFTSTGSNVEIFDSNADYILIGSDATFEVINVMLSINSSKDVELAYYYSKAGGNWTALPIQGDTTNGFQNSGNISFDAPGDWSKDDEAEANGDITNAYYVKLERTFATNIPTLPTESQFTIVTDQGIGMSILGSGLVVLPYLAGIPADVVNGAIWMEADGLHVYYAGAEALVADGVP